MAKAYALVMQGYEFNDAGYDLVDKPIERVYLDYNEAKAACDKINSDSNVEEEKDYNYDQEKIVHCKIIEVQLG
jgi:hypothetical protein